MEFKKDMKRSLITIFLLSSVVRADVMYSDLLPNQANFLDFGSILYPWDEVYLNIIKQGTWQGSAIGVPYGGTGAVSFTNGGLIYGGGTGPLAALAVSAQGELPIGDGSGAPTLATLTQRSGLLITNGTGSIEIGIAVDGVNDLHIDWGLGASQVNAADVPIAVGTGSPTVDQIQEYFDNVGSSGYFTGGELSDGGSGTVDVNSGEGFIRTSANDNAPLLSFKWSASAGVAVADNTTQYVFVDDTGTINLSSDEFAEAVDNIMLGVVTDEGGAISHAFNLGVRLEESIGQMGRYIRHVDDVVRNRRKGGLIFGESGDPNRFVTVTAGQLEWGRTSYPIPFFNTSGADTFDTYSAGGQEATGVSAWPNTQYDNAGTLTTMNNNRWAVLWWYIEPDGHIVMLYGRAQYVTEGQAEEEEQPSSSIPNRISSASVIASKFIFQKSEDTTAKIETAFGTPFTGSGVTSHNNLANLGFASAAHTGFLASDGSVALAGAWDMNSQNLTNVNVDSGTIDAVTLGTNSPVTEAQIDNININGNKITGSTDIQFKPSTGSAREYQLSTTCFCPLNNNQVDLGSVAGASPFEANWRHLYLSGNLSDGTNALTIADANTAYTHSQVSGNDGIHGTNYLKDDANDSTTGIITATGFSVGDFNYATFGVGDGNLAGDGVIYSDGNDLIVQAESPTGVAPSVTNPGFKFTYVDLFVSGEIYSPHLTTTDADIFPFVITLAPEVISIDPASGRGGEFKVSAPNGPAMYGSLKYNDTEPPEIFFGSSGDIAFRISAGSSFDIKLQAKEVQIDGDMNFINGGGLYPRRISQAAQPASGTGSTQIDVGEQAIWRDSDANAVWLMYNDTNEGILKVQLQ